MFSTRILKKRQFFHILPAIFFNDLEGISEYDRGQSRAENVPMTTTSETYRDNAHNCEQLAAAATNEPARKRYRRMAEAWLALAEEQDWLDGNVPPIPDSKA